MPDTEQDIFDSALSNEAPEVIHEEPQTEAPAAEEPKETRPRDDKGRFAPKTEAEPEKVAPTPEPEQEQEAQPDKPERDGGIPAWRLREEAEAKREALAQAEQARRDAEEARRQMAAFQQQMATLQRQVQEKQNPPPDMYADPEGYQRHQQQIYEQRLQAQALAFSEQLARVKFGDELYDKAERELGRHVQTNPHDPIVHVILNSSRPAFEVVQWFQQREAQQRFGGKSIDDLLKEEREKLLNDPAFLANAVEKAKATAKPAATTANTTIPSLNRATAAASNSIDEEKSDGDFLKSLLPR